MKKIIFLPILIFLFSSIRAHGETDPYSPNETGHFGLGLVLFEPTAITGIYWNSKDTAIDAGLSFFASDYFTMYGDYLWHKPGLFGHSSQFISQLNPYIGAGGGLFTWSNHEYFYGHNNSWHNGSSGTGLYARMPLGIEWNLRRPSIGFFGELVPELSISPGLGFFLDLGIGARYYFQ